MAEFRGLFPPLITPMDKEGNIDEKGLRDHVDFMIESGSDGMCAGSSTGEFSNFTRDEWERVVAIAYEQAAGRVPVLAGSAWMSTKETIERSEFARNLGCDGLLVISPWYQVHTERELYEHYKALHEAVPLPIMIYNNPPVTGVQLSVALLARLAEEGIVQYLKDADPDPYNIARLKLRLGDRLGIFYGHDNNAIGAFAFGATGWVSGTSNFDPKRWSRFVHTCIDDGDFKAARRMWYEMLPFIEMATVGESNERPDWIAVIKEGLRFRGREVGPVRRPMLPLRPEAAAKLEKIVKAMSF